MPRVYFPHNKIPGVYGGEYGTSLGRQNLNRTSERQYSPNTFLRPFIHNNICPKINTYPLIRDIDFYPGIIAPHENGEVAIENWMTHVFGGFTWGLNGGRVNPIETGTPAAVSYDVHKDGRFYPNLLLSIINDSEIPFSHSIIDPTRGGTWCREAPFGPGFSSGEDTSTQQAHRWFVSGSKQYSWGIPGGAAQQESTSMKGARQCVRYKDTSSYVFRQIINGMIYYKIQTEYNPLDIQVRNPIKTSFKELGEIISSRFWYSWVFAESIRNLYPALFLLSQGFLKGYPVDQDFFMFSVTALVTTQTLSWGFANAVKGFNPFVTFLKIPAVNWIAYSEILRGNSFLGRRQDPSPGEFPITREATGITFNKSNFRIMDIFMGMQIAALGSFTLGLLQTGDSSPAFWINALWAGYQLSILSLGKNYLNQSNSYIHSFDMPKRTAQAIINEINGSTSIDDLQNMLLSLSRRYDNNSRAVNSGRIAIGTQQINISALVRALNVTYENSLGYNIGLSGRQTQSVADAIRGKIISIVEPQIHNRAVSADQKISLLANLNTFEENARRYIQSSHNLRDILTDRRSSIRTGGFIADLIPYFDKNLNAGRFTEIGINEETNLHNEISALRTELTDQTWLQMLIDINGAYSSSLPLETRLNELRRMARIAQSSGMTDVFIQANFAFQNLIQNERTMVLR